MFRFWIQVMMEAETDWQSCSEITRTIWSVGWFSVVRTTNLYCQARLTEPGLRLLLVLLTRVPELLGEGTVQWV